MFLLNTLKDADIIFFCICVAVIVLVVAIYFLIPVFKAKEFRERRESLKKREEAFYANKKSINENEIKE